MCSCKSVFLKTSSSYAIICLSKARAFTDHICTVSKMDIRLIRMLRPKVVYIKDTFYSHKQYALGRKTLQTHMLELHFKNP